MTRFFLTLCVALFLLGAMAVAQSSHHFPTPPEPMDQDKPAQAPPSDAKAMRQIDYAKLQREADELAREAQTIPADVASARQGTLPKDVIEKLKQIEKLSKRLRAELNP